jgi:cytochrome P450
LDLPSKDNDHNPERGVATSDHAQSWPSKVVTPGPSSVISFDGYVDPLKFLGQLWQQYGDVVRYQTRFGPCFLFVYPRDVQTILRNETFRRGSLIKMMFGDGLLVSEGPRWKSQRRVMQGDFLPRSVAPLVPVMVREAARTADAWRQAAVAGHTVDVSIDMARLTMRIIVKAMFSDDLSESEVAELCAAVALAVSEQGKLSWLVFGIPAHFTPESAANITSSKAVLDAAAYEMIRRRRLVASCDRPQDILTLLIEADTDSGPMSDPQIRDEIVTLLIAGHETTALSLTWAWKAIAEHPDIEMTMHRELDQVLGGKCAELEDAARLTWTRAIFQETMRVYPPVWYMARVASEDTLVHGHVVPRGANVLISPWFTHRHKEFWPDPERFDPTRFVSSPAQATHRDAYLPFAGGRHICLGMHFALLEGTLVLAQIAQEFRVRPVNAQEIRPNGGVTLRLSPGLSATIELRDAPRHGGTPVARPAAL